MKEDFSFDLSGFVAEVKQNPKVLFNSPEKMKLIQSLKELSHGDYLQLREALKKIGKFRIAEFDNITEANGETKSPIDELIEIGKSSASLFHDSSKIAFAEVTIGEMKDVFPIKSEGFAQWLQSVYYKKSGKGVCDSVIKGSIDCLSAIAIQDGPTLEVHIRSAKDGDGYLIDLTDKGRRTIKINSEGWSIQESSPIKFIRNSNSKPLPNPDRIEPNLDLLWEHVNIPQEDRDLLLAGILESFRPDTPHVLISFIGEQGSSKSTSQSRIRDLVDPNRVPLRAAPKSCEDIAINAYRNWLVSYENLSALTPAQQDLLCTILTGGGIATRKLYSNFDEASIQIKRPIILNGISSVVTRPDLLDRAIIFDLPSISPQDRRLQAICDQEWEEARASVFTALLDLFSATLRKLPSVHIAQLPRMADFARFGEAMSRAQGKPNGSFLQRYLESRKEIMEIALEGDPVAMALDTYLERRPMGSETTTKYLLSELEKSKASGDRKFPRSARGLGNALRRLAPAFRQRGWKIMQKRTDRGVVVYIDPTEVQPETSSERALPSLNEMHVLNVQTKHFHGEEI